MNAFDRLIQELGKIGVTTQKGAPLSMLTTFRVGGPCDLLISPESEEQTADSLRLIKESMLPLAVIGRGSNVLFPDSGYRGCVLRIGLGFSRIRLLSDTELECDAGLSLREFCEYACQRNLSGLEFAFGIPGTVGGAAYMNAGAYGGEMKDIIAQTRHLDRDGRGGGFSGKELDFAYRHSVYVGKEFVITAVRVALQPGDPVEIRARMDDYMNRRREKQPLDYPSAGSTFKRPAGNYASALIDQCGLKGMRVGGAVVSEKHAGFVVNTGGATCSDILNLIGKIKEEVLRQTGYELEREVKYIDS